MTVYRTLPSRLRRLRRRWRAGLSARLHVGLVGGMTAAFRRGLAPATRPNVVLVTLDSLRADRLGYLSPGPTLTPNLDRLAEESVCFTRAIAPAPWTKPSVSSLLTGLYPSAHGAFLRGAYGARVTSETDPTKANVIHRGVLTLAERLTAAGYATAAFTGGGFAHQVLQGRGFGHFDSGGACLPDLLHQCARWVATRPRAPFFAWIHSFDSHRPYLGRCAVARYLRRRPFALTNADVLAINSGRVVPTRRQVSRLANLYDAGVRQMDRRMGVLLRALGVSGLLSCTVLVFTSDHGEALYEHGLVEHSDVIYNEALKVPLMIRAPGMRPRSIDQYVRLIDVAPTILELAGLSAPTMQGVSLVPAMVKETELRLTALSELEMVGRPRALQLTYDERDYKIIHWTETDAWALFDLSDDPAEMINLSGQGGVVEEVLRARLDAQLQESAGWAGKLQRDGRRDNLAPIESDEVAERLRELGYID